VSSVPRRAQENPTDKKVPNSPLGNLALFKKPIIKCIKTL